jgi:hypothetical protein
MRTIKNIFIITCLTTVLLISESSYASTIVNGSTESKKMVEKYTLKNIGNLTHKTASFYTLKSSLEFKGIASINMNGSVNNSNYLKYNKGNISYIIPYRHKVILSKFKTPSPVQP